MGRACLQGKSTDRLFTEGQEYVCVVCVPICCVPLVGGHATSLLRGGGHSREMRDGGKTGACYAGGSPGREWVIVCVGCILI